MVPNTALLRRCDLGAASAKCGRGQKFAHVRKPPRKIPGYAPGPEAICAPYGWVFTPVLLVDLHPVLLVDLQALMRFTIPSVGATDKDLNYSKPHQSL